jgi:hypothetical protein
MWVKLSTDNIMPGLGMVDEMMQDRGSLEAAQKKAAKLNAWSIKAQKAVIDIAAKVRRVFVPPSAPSSSTSSFVLAT